MSNLKRPGQPFDMHSSNVRIGLNLLKRSGSQFGSFAVMILGQSQCPVVLEEKFSGEMERLTQGGDDLFRWGVKRILYPRDKSLSDARSASYLLLSESSRAPRQPKHIAVKVLHRRPLLLGEANSLQPWFHSRKTFRRYVFPDVRPANFYDLGCPDDFFSLWPCDHHTLTLRKGSIGFVTKRHTKSGGREVRKLLLSIKFALLFGVMISMETFLVHLLPPPNNPILNIYDS